MSERDLFIAALERDDPAERDAYLSAACGGDADLRRRVERLLRLHQEAGSFLKPPAVAPGQTVDPQTGAFLGGPEDAKARSIRGADPTRPPRRPAPALARTSCCRSSARAAWAPSGSPSSTSRSNAAWP